MTASGSWLTSKGDYPFVLKNGNLITQEVRPHAYSISATSDGYVFVGCSDYTTTGDVYMMTSEGTLHAKFDSQGLNPIAVMGY